MILNILFVNSRLLFRSWFYFRQGWSIYFAFVMAAINTLTVTYFLAVEKYPGLNQLFPSFLHYVLYATLIGIPVLTFTGYAHFKKMAGYKAEADIGFEANPYLRRMLLNSEFVIPIQIRIIELLVKIYKNEKLTDEELAEISKLQNELKDHLLVKEDSKLDQMREKDFNKLKSIDK